MIVRPRSIYVVLVSALLCLSSGFAQAAYPDRTVRIVVPYPPGGGADALARIVAHKLSQKLHQSFIIETRPGAASMTGSAYVAHSNPDGYTLLMGSSGNTAMFAVHKSVPYNLDRDLTPICKVATVPNFVVVGESTPYKSVKELIDAAKKHPGQLAGGTTGYGGTPYLLLEQFALATKTDIKAVNYKGSPPAQLDLMAGRIAFMFDNAGLPLIQAGKLRALAVAAPRRSPFLPNVPTLAQVGVHGVNLGVWYGMWAPSGTPHKSVERLINTLKPILGSGEVKQRVSQLGDTVDVECGGRFKRFIDKELVKYKKAATAAHIKMLD